MSAFIPSPEHIGLLAACLTQFRKSAADPRDNAEILAREVIASVAYLYPSDKGNGDRPGPCLTDEQIVAASRLYAEHFAAQFPDWLSAQDLDSLVRCYEYQASEHPGWADSPAMMLIAKLPGGARFWAVDTSGGRIRWEYNAPEEDQLPEVLAMYEREVT